MKHHRCYAGNHSLCISNMQKDASEISTFFRQVVDNATLCHHSISRRDSDRKIFRKVVNVVHRILTSNEFWNPKRNSGNRKKFCARPPPTPLHHSGVNDAVDRCSGENCLDIDRIGFLYRTTANGGMPPPCPHWCSPLHYQARNDPLRRSRLWTELAACVKQ